MPPHTASLHKMLKCYKCTPGENLWTPQHNTNGAQNTLCMVFLNTFYDFNILTFYDVILVKLSVGLLWLKLHSTRRGLFLLTHWTWN